MAQLQKSTSTKLKDGSKDKFYDFFKFHVDSITDICPNLVKSIQLTDGTTSWEASTGNRKEIEFKSPSGAIIKVKDKVTNVSDASRTIIYEIENGGILGDITKVKLEVTEDSLAVLAKWTVYYNNTDPQEYLALLKSVSQAVDNHIK